MHYVTAKGILSAKNGMNLYRGCQHGCIYCDSRSDCYHMEHDFEDIEVKENALVLLENALRRKRKPCMIGTGSMSDPYMPLEEELQYTRKALELIFRYGFGATLITKSDRVLQDLDLLKVIHDKTKCVVQMTLTTYYEELCRKLEPGVCTTKARFEALKALQDAGIPTVVWLCPILPFQRYGRKYQRDSGLLPGSRCEGCHLLWNGRDLAHRQSGVFLSAAGPPFFRTERGIYPPLRRCLYAGQSPQPGTDASVP